MPRAGGPEFGPPLGSEVAAAAAAAVAWGRQSVVRRLTIPCNAKAKVACLPACPPACPPA